MNTNKSLTPVQLKTLYIATYKQSKGNLFDFTALMTEQNDLLDESTIAVIFDMISVSENEKVIVSSGCHCCIFLHFSNETEDEVCKLNEELYCSPCAINEVMHPQCPLLTNTIKVLKND